MAIDCLDASFWKDKKVFITGHTGFKGSWLCMLLDYLGAEVYGYALLPPTEPNLYHICHLDEIVHSTIGDIRDLQSLNNAMRVARPEIVIHMAAQPIVRYSYENPLETYSVNVMGTINILESVRAFTQVKALVNVTTDKCYENKEWLWGYREEEPLGGYDPYSSSKACSEIITASYRRSFFCKIDKTSIATARAGNVIGGGDWAKDRLIPDIIRAVQKKEKVIIRNPEAIRPWQHVLEPLTGYLTVAEKLFKYGESFTGAWNFGPDDTDSKSVEWIVKRICKEWGADYEVTRSPQPHEAHYLKLDCSKAKSLLNWFPRWKLERTIKSIIDFNKALQNNSNIQDVCKNDIIEYLNQN